MSNIFQYVSFRIRFMKQELLWNKLFKKVQKLSLAQLGGIIDNNNLSLVATEREIRRLKSWSSSSGKTDYVELMSLIQQKFYEIKIMGMLNRFNQKQLEVFSRDHIDDKLFSEGEKNYLMQHPYFWHKCQVEALEQLTSN